MKKQIQELLMQLCPKGIKHQELSNICIVKKGCQISDEDIKENGKYPILHDKVNDLVYSDKFNATNAITIISKGLQAGTVSYVNDSFWCGTNAYYIEIEDENISPKYLYYYLKNKEQEFIDLLKSNIKTTILQKNVIDNVITAIPPMEIQEEIINAIDKLTIEKIEYEKSIEKELEFLEVKCREEQQKLLMFDDKDTYVKLNDVATICKGETPRPLSKYITNDLNSFNYVKSSDINKKNKYITITKEKISIEGSKKSKLAKIGTIIIYNSIDYNKPYIMKIEGYINDALILISDFDKTFKSEFLYYILCTNSIINSINKSILEKNAKNIGVNVIKSLNIPIIPLDKQSSIISELDKIDKKYINLAKKLSKDLEKHLIQYETQKRRLLTFRKLS